MPTAPLSKSESLKVPQIFAQALALHHQGRLTDAERLYSEVLAHRPDHFDALQMLSVIRLAKGDASGALRLISAAMRARKRASSAGDAEPSASAIVSASCR